VSGSRNLYLWYIMEGYAMAGNRVTERSAAMTLGLNMGKAVFRASLMINEI